MLQDDITALFIDAGACKVKGNSFFKDKLISMLSNHIINYHANKSTCVKQTHISALLNCTPARCNLW